MLENVLMIHRYFSQDKMDFEWEFWTRAVAFVIPALLIHMVGGLVFSRFLPKVRSL